MCEHCTATVANHLDKPEQDEGEDYVDYLARCAAFWSEHPPAAPEGFELIPCECEPRCWPHYTVRDNDFYEGYCEGPHIRHMTERIAKLEHAQHKAIWRVKPIAWLLLLAPFVTGYTTQWGSECQGCVTWEFKRPKGMGASRARRDTAVAVRHGRGIVMTRILIIPALLLAAAVAASVTVLQIIRNLERGAR